MKVERKYFQLILGDEYTVYWSYKDKMHCKFIQVTEKCFNFLNLKTNKCILRHHLYRSKLDQKLFSINYLLKIELISN